MTSALDLDFALNKFQVHLILNHLGVPPQLSGFICTFHPAAWGFSPKHTIYASIILINFMLFLSLHCEETKINKKRPGLGQLKNFKTKPECKTILIIKQKNYDRQNIDHIVQFLLSLIFPNFKDSQKGAIWPFRSE